MTSLQKRQRNFRGVEVQMGIKTLQMRAAIARVKSTSQVKRGGYGIFENWENKTQVINLFVRRTNRKNCLVGFHIKNKFKNQINKNITFTPSYNQLLSFLSELDNWQSEPVKGDVDFWLELAHMALRSLARRDEKYDIMFKIIDEKLKDKDFLWGSPQYKQTQRHFGPIHCGFHLNRLSVNKRDPRRGVNRGVDLSKMEQYEYKAEAERRLNRLTPD